MKEECDLTHKLKEVADNFRKSQYKTTDEEVVNEHDEDNDEFNLSEASEALQQVPNDNY